MQAERANNAKAQYSRLRDDHGTRETHRERPPRFTLPDHILLGCRHNTLLSYSGSLRAYGHSAKEIHAELIRVNRERCDPPLLPRDLHKLAEWVARKPPGTAKGARVLDMAAVRALANAHAAVAAHPWTGTLP